MKIAGIVLFLLTSLNLNADVSGIMCQNDERMNDNNGGLKELTLAKGENGYSLQLRTIASLTSPENNITVLATGLECRLDNGKMAIGICQTLDGVTQVMIKEIKEIFYDSMDPAATRKTSKSLAVVITENGEAKPAITFDSADCKTH